jgi:thiol-disulfide isomerase/thioredoxin
MISLRTYQAECWTTLTFRSIPPAKPKSTRYEFATLIAAKPNRMRYDQWRSKRGQLPKRPAETETTEITFASNGKRVWRQFGDQYRTDENTGPEYMHTILEPWDGFYVSQSSLREQIGFDLQRKELIEAIRLSPVAVEGTPCDRVFIHKLGEYGGETQDSRATWYIGRDGLVRRCVESIDFGGKPGFTRDSIIRNIRINQPIADPAHTFVYNPPAGVKLQKPVQERPVLANGTVAPDFTATDASGKPVKLSDYRGKVVVLDFWASWCGPCVASMPHTQEVAKKLAAENAPFVVLAIDNSEKRPDFLKWVQSRSELDKIVFAQVEKPDIAGESYKVSGIPTQFVIDAQGIIRASFVGYNGPSDVLESAVRSALAK